MGKPWNNESAEKWWACGRHVRQKELAPSAKVRRTTPKKFLPPGLPPYTVHLSLGVWGHCLRGTRCVPRVAPRVVGRYVLNAPEGCPHGTHTSGTAYTRGTCPHKHPQTQTNTQSTLCHGRANVRRSRPWQPQHRRKSHHRTSTPGVHVRRRVVEALRAVVLAHAGSREETLLLLVLLQFASSSLVGRARRPAPVDVPPTHVPQP
jgi:hypothetical protein